MKTSSYTLIVVLLLPSLFSQRPPSANSPNNQYNPPSNSNVNVGSSSGFSDTGSALALSDKVFNTESDIIDFEQGTFTWKGKTFSIENSRIFKARFERYLNSPIPSRILEYNQEIDGVLQQLTLNNSGIKNEDLLSAWIKLFDIAEYDEDEKNALVIANTVNDIWSVMRENRSFSFAKDDLERLERYQQAVVADRQENVMRQLERRSKAIRSSSTKSQGVDKSIDESLKKLGEELESEEQFRVQDLGKTTAKIASLETRSISNAVQAKLTFQSQIFSFFTQRRFKHCLIACHFYRHLFKTSAQKLEVGTDTLKKFFPDSNFLPTINTIEQLSQEAIADIKKSMIAIEKAYLTDKKVTALRRLQETFFLGEQHSLVKVFDFEKKQQLYHLYQEMEASRQLLDLKDYDALELTVEKIISLTSDFPDRSVLAFTNATKRASNISLMSAQQHFISRKVEEGRIYLEKAIQLWPLSPAINEFTNQMNREVNMTVKATEVFDNLLERQNYREIYDRSMELGLAFYQDPERAAKLKEISQDVLRIDGLIVQSDELVLQENAFAAWELLDQAATIDPNDPVLNRAQSKLAPKVASYVSVIDQAQLAEKKGFYPESLVKYLQAQDQYPASRICRLGIERVSTSLLKMVEGSIEAVKKEVVKEL